MAWKTKILHFALIVLAIVIGGSVWTLATPWLLHGGSFDGASLIWSKSGVVVSLIMAILFGVPAMVLAAGCGTLMRWTTGLMVIAITLGTVAVASGPIDGLIWSFTPTTDALPSLRTMYLGLVVEAVLWGVFMLGLAWGLASVALCGHGRVPQRWADPGIKLGNWTFDPVGLIKHVTDANGVEALKSGGIIVILGTLLTWVLCRNNEPGQVVGALVIGFGVASFAAQRLQPTRELSPALAAPFVSAVFSYLYTALTMSSNAAALEAWYVDALWTPAVALPIYYACAGSAGVLLGAAFGLPFEEESEDAEATENTEATEPS